MNDQDHRQRPFLAPPKADDKISMIVSQFSHKIDILKVRQCLETSKTPGPGMGRKAGGTSLVTPDAVAEPDGVASCQLPPINEMLLLVSRLQAGFPLAQNEVLVAALRDRIIFFFVFSGRSLGFHKAQERNFL
jgi:hypothetical protein